MRSSSPGRTGGKPAEPFTRRTRVGPLAAGFEQVAGRPKFYVLDMFAYPSGAGLHVGHAVGYIGTDVYARFLRMTGYAVLHPYGYDAFGLPAEQYAIDTGQHPAITTKINIGIMRRQLRRLGLGHDVRREIATTDPGFYRWTQWIFLQIFGSWFDEDLGRARPVAELIAEFEAGTRAPDGPANPDGRPWAELDQVTRRRVVDDRRLAYISDELVNWSPDLEHGAGQRGGQCRRAQPRRELPGIPAAAAAVDAAHHRVRRPAGGRP